MNDTETLPLNQPNGNQSNGTRPDRRFSEPVASESVASESTSLSPVKEDSEGLQSLADLIGRDAREDAAIYLHRANTHHNGE